MKIVKTTLIIAIVAIVSFSFVSCEKADYSDTELVKASELEASTNGLNASQVNSKTQRTRVSWYYHPQWHITGIGSKTYSVGSKKVVITATNTSNHRLNFIISANGFEIKNFSLDRYETYGEVFNENWNNVRIRVSHSSIQNMEAFVTVGYEL